MLRQHCVTKRQRPRRSTIRARVMTALWRASSPTITAARCAFIRSCT